MNVPDADSSLQEERAEKAEVDAERQMSPLKGTRPEAAQNRGRSAAPKPRRVSVFAAIVSLIAVAGAVLLGIYGQPIDVHRGRAVIAEPEEVAAWVAAEHDRFETDPGYIQEKLLVLSRRIFEERLGGSSPVRNRLYEVMDEAGFRFLGAAPSGLPVDWAGSHVAFVSGLPPEVPQSQSSDVPSGQPQGSPPRLDLSLLSVVIVPNVGQFGEWANVPGARAELRDLPARGSGRRRNVHVFSDGAAIYFLTGGVFGELQGIMQQWTTVESAP